MSTDMTASRGNSPASRPSGNTAAFRPSGNALAMPGGTGAVGQANQSMVRMTALLEQALKAFLILQDVGVDLRREAIATADMAEHLTASFGERVSLEQLVVIANMLTQIAEGSLTVVANGRDAVNAALVANFQVLIAQEALHSTGADGAYIDSQRRAG